MKIIAFKAATALGRVRLYLRLRFLTVDSTERRIDSTEVTIDKISF